MSPRPVSARRLDRLAAAPLARRRLHASRAHRLVRGRPRQGPRSPPAQPRGDRSPAGHWRRARRRHRRGATAAPAAAGPPAQSHRSPRCQRRQRVWADRRPPTALLRQPAPPQLRSQRSPHPTHPRHSRSLWSRTRPEGNSRRPRPTPAPRPSRCTRSKRAAGRSWRWDGTASASAETSMPARHPSRVRGKGWRSETHGGSDARGTFRERGKKGHFGSMVDVWTQVNQPGTAGPPAESAGPAGCTARPAPAASGPP